MLGLDFDNTIVCYDESFARIACERGLLDSAVPPTKHAVREDLRRKGYQEKWIELQGVVYGHRINEARPFPGVLETCARIREQGMDISIISHKTQFPHRGPRVALREVARSWLRNQGFFDPARGGLDPKRVFFEPTKERKLQRIAEQGCRWFVDDLPEFLGEPGFPRGAQRILFDPHGRNAGDARFLRIGRWDDLESCLGTLRAAG